MKEQKQNYPLTFEGTRALIQDSNRYLTELQAENARQMKETDRQMKETDRQMKETDRQIREKQAETALLLKENALQMKENERIFHEKCDRLDKMFAQTREQIGGISQSNGDFCEEYFVNAFQKDPTFLGEKFDYAQESLKPHPIVVNDQYDLVLSNGSTIALIEMKYKARVDDVGRMFRKLETYRANFPMHKDYKTYLALASFSFSDAVRKRADEMGVVLIQQQGEKIEVISDNVRTW
ncbi:MAG: hypothetical protein FWD09_07720 [Lentimicrobiaceae bacterium]|nr:hypothetical protein [Lentimicrobiaceae bacterium]